MINLAASIVTYNNSKKTLEESVYSFLNASPDSNLYIIDNSPTPVFQYLDRDRRINYLHNPLNPGFGASHNIALKKSLEKDIKYHIVLNPDVYFDAISFNRMCDFMEENSDIGQLMPRVLYPDGTNQYLCKKNPTFFDLFIRGFIPVKFHFLFGNRIKSYQYENHDPSKIIYDIPYLSGCFMFLRMDVLRKVGLFDDKFFMYLEDADLTRRICDYSKTVYYPHAVIYHHFARYTHKKIRFKLITIQSAFTYFNKWGWFRHLI